MNTLFDDRDSRREDNLVAWGCLSSVHWHILCSCGHVYISMSTSTCTCMGCLIEGHCHCFCRFLCPWSMVGQECFKLVKFWWWVNYFYLQKKKKKKAFQTFLSFAFSCHSLHVLVIVFISVIPFYLLSLAPCPPHSIHLCL